MLSLVNEKIIKDLLKKHSITPNKFLGQNFLIDQKALDRIIETADLRPGDNVLEIGPGLGTLTQSLLAKGANVVAIEKDKELIPVLEENLEEFKNWKIIKEDFLQVDFEEISSAFSGYFEQAERVKGFHQFQNSHIIPLGSLCLSKTTKITKQENFNYKVVSNIPYYITSPVLRKIFSFSVLPTEIIFLVQREVAERIANAAGGMSLISFYTQYFGEPSIQEILKPESFWPAPKVESAILKIILKKKQNLSLAREKELWSLAKIGFSSRRKTLANNLAAGFHKKNSNMKEILKKTGFRENIRAQELDVKDWIRLMKEIKEIK